MNNRNLSIIDEVFAPDYIVHYPGMDPIHGRDKAKEAIGALQRAPAISCSRSKIRWRRETKS